MAEGIIGRSWAASLKRLSLMKPKPRSSILLDANTGDLAMGASS